jgi:hypothetical protein
MKSKSETHATTESLREWFTCTKSTSISKKLRRSKFCLIEVQGRGIRIGKKSRDQSFAELVIGHTTICSSMVVSQRSLIAAPSHARPTLGPSRARRRRPLRSVFGDALLASFSAMAPSASRRTPPLRVRGGGGRLFLVCLAAWASPSTCSAAVSLDACSALSEYRQMVAPRVCGGGPARCVRDGGSLLVPCLYVTMLLEQPHVVPVSAGVSGGGRESAPHIIRIKHMRDRWCKAVRRSYVFFQIAWPCMVRHLCIDFFFQISFIQG